MQHIIPADRYQLSFGSLDELMDVDNPVRFLDAFADKMDLEKLGFQLRSQQTESRPSFDPKLFLKIYEKTQKMETEIPQGMADLHKNKAFTAY